MVSTEPAARKKKNNIGLYRVGCIIVAVFHKQKSGGFTMRSWSRAWGVAVAIHLASNTRSTPSLFRARTTRKSLSCLFYTAFFSCGILFLLVWFCLFHFVVLIVCVSVCAPLTIFAAAAHVVD